MPRLPPPGPTTGPRPTVVREHRLDFDPRRHGFGFPNAFVNVVLALPNGQKVTTSGRCGGMAYAAADHWLAHVPVPPWTAATYAPGRVPPKENWLGDYIYRRQLESFLVASALKFALWSVLPDERAWYSAGLHALTLHDEVPELVRRLDEGHPVVLGLVVARELGAMAHNHQVLAYGYEVDEHGATTVLVYDSNAPGRQTRLTPTDDGWHSTTGELWRGFFLQDYAPATPPALISAALEPTRRLRGGDVIRLAHVESGRVLRADDNADTGGAVSTEGPGHPDAVESWWRLVVPDPTGPTAPLCQGSVVRLEHIATGRWLSSRRGVRSPVTGQQAVSCADTADDWLVEVDGRASQWTAGSRVRLVHRATNAALHSHDHELRGTDRGEVTCFAERDANDWWIVASAR